MSELIERLRQSMCEQFAGVDLDKHARLIAFEVERAHHALSERDGNREPDPGNPRSDGAREEAA